MQDIIIEKPYRFQTPYQSTLAPYLFQRFRLVDRFLRHYEGICSHEVRGIEHLKESLRRQAGIVLAPNHCRYSDPLAMAWVLRPAGVYPYAMASWHLFHHSFAQSQLIRLCGGFSVNREAVDRQALDMAVSGLVEGQRPLILFPEGTVFRSNDRLQPFLDGVAFIARTAARRRAKQGKSSTVIHPVAIKYLFQGDVIQTITPVVEEMEHRFAWYLPTCRARTMVERVSRLTDAYLVTKEIEHCGSVAQGNSQERRLQLIEQLLRPLEKQWLKNSPKETTLVPRIKALRLLMMPLLLSDQTPPREKQQIRLDLSRIYTAQQIGSYPEGYLDSPVTNTRLLETVEQLEEDIWGKARVHKPLHAILQVGPAIEVTDQRPAKESVDPLMEQLETRIREMLVELSSQAQVVA